MKNTVKNFKTKNFYDASLELFKKLSIPLDSITELSIEPSDIFESQKYFFDKIKDIYTLGMVSDSLFSGEDQSGFIYEKKEKYDGVLIFTIELNESKPTRSLLSDIARAFNREYHYTPVIVLFKYDDKLSLANTQRQNYKINKEGEKAGKVTILRDINISNPHTGHLKILNDMKIPSKIKSYDELYKHWQEVFDVSILNKAFYKELQNWYFYAINEVVYPNEPRATDPEFDNDKLKEYRAKNVIRLLTRLLFVWFIKEKGLIPNKLFEEDEIKKLIKNFEPRKQDQETLFGGHDKESRYYKAILQNLFFATLNQEMKQRAFRKDGANQNTTNLMRYKKYFENPDDFISLVESVVPFMNGGLFECLDAPHPIKRGRQGGDIIVYEDGFSDRDNNPLIVPDYIFFGHEDHIDLSVEYGSKNKAFKDASVKGLINILKSYKFTIAENTPIEEDVALDPELLGKVFENLLASYNPETKTTARKQTGSFYTPREIVSYMIDESLIAYLKTKLEGEVADKDELDKKLHGLLAYDDNNPFSDDDELTKRIIDAINEIKILDPAVGSGAFPMGALQKMVHLLSKLDPKNTYWQDLQLKKAQDETNDAFKSNDRNSIKEKVDEIFDSFDETINNPDYARKLYLIENTIFGVDIQPIAIQISKLRFFISLVVEQNINNDKENFGIRPLPNLESKFVAANTLIALEKEQQSLFDRTDIKVLENELQNVRHKIFNAKTPKTKRKYREKDKELRKEIKQTLLDGGIGNNTAEQLSSWDPYDQNSSSSFFDMEWMFGIKDGFDIVIGNPPYVRQEKLKEFKKILEKESFKSYNSTADLYIFFFEKGYDFLKNDGYLTYITSNKYTRAQYGIEFRSFLIDYTLFYKYIDFNGVKVFESATVDTSILIFQKKKSRNNSFLYCDVDEHYKKDNILEQYIKDNGWEYKQSELKKTGFSFVSSKEIELLNKIDESGTPLKDWSININYGIKTGFNEAFIIDSSVKNELIKKDPKNSEVMKPLLRGKDIKRYSYTFANKWLINIHNNPPVDINQYPTLKEHLDQYYEKLSKRSDKGVTPYNLRNCAYLESFDEEKIIYPETTQTTDVFILDNKKMYLDKTCFMIVGENLKFITSVLNSKLFIFYMQNKVRQVGKGYQISKIFAEKLPIKRVSKLIVEEYSSIIKLLLNKKQNSEDTIELENQIDQMVYELYELTEDEIKIVEDSIK